MSQAQQSLREIALTTLRHREGIGRKYRPGVIDEAVSRAAEAKDQESVIDAMIEVFYEYEFPVVPT